MYSIGDVKSALGQPKLIARELNRLYHTRMRSQNYNEAAGNVFDEDWDNLILLDACRYDAFEQALEEFDLPGETESRRSRGACTIEFLRGNFDDRDLSDTVYVAATSMLYRMIVIEDELEHNLHHVDDVWEDAIDVGEWGVSPERVADRVRELNEEFPDKRLLVHFIQPHIPFIGEYGAEELNEQKIWMKTFTGDFEADDESLWKAYMANLMEVLPAVRTLLTELPGKTVVTSDHGQLIGDTGFPVPIREYGHPNGIYQEELVKVPWHVYQNGPRKSIVAEPDGENSYGEKDREEIDEKAKEHLENLGYL